jgi:hypothetical protein
MVGRSLLRDVDVSRNQPSRISQPNLHRRSDSALVMPTRAIR